MNFMGLVFDNKAVTVPILAWFIAQGLKVVTVIIRERKFDFTRFIGSGGMPSSHSSYIVSLAAVIGKNEGPGSPAFAIAVAVAFIVMYDAAGIRRAAGRQARVLNKLVHSSLDRVNIDEKLKELLGHTPLEVLMGALLGLLIGIVAG